MHDRSMDQSWPPAVALCGPGARTAWHTHPLGQTLIATSSLGLVRRKGGPFDKNRPGDVVWFQPEEKHWQGASPKTAMSHIAVQEKQNGSPVIWVEQVSDEQYQGCAILHVITVGGCEPLPDFGFMPQSGPTALRPSQSFEIS